MAESLVYSPRSLKKDTHFIFFYHKRLSRGEPTRWKIVITRKSIPLATQRNRWRRRIREILRKHKDKFLPNREVVLKLWKATPPLTACELEDKILKLIDESRVGKI